MLPLHYLIPIARAYVNGYAQDKHTGEYYHRGYAALTSVACGLTLVTGAVAGFAFGHHDWLLAALLLPVAVALLALAWVCEKRITPPPRPVVFVSSSGLTREQLDDAFSNVRHRARTIMCQDVH